MSHILLYTIYSELIFLLGFKLGEDGETGTSGGHVINTIIPDGGNHNKGSADGGHHHRAHHNNPNGRSKAQKQKQNNIKRFQPMIG